MPEKNYFDSTTVPKEFSTKAAPIVAKYAGELAQLMRSNLLSNPKGGYRGNKPGWGRGGAKRAAARDHPVPLAESMEARVITPTRYKVGVWDHQYAQYVEFQTFAKVGKIEFLYPAAGVIRPQLMGALSKLMAEVMAE